MITYGRYHKLKLASNQRSHIRSSPLAQDRNWRGEHAFNTHHCKPTPSFDLYSISRRCHTLINMSFRSSRTLLNEAKNYASSHKFTYVEGKTPFWRKFREVFSANPEISSGIPVIETNRWPQPASRPERSATPPSAASDIAGNLYHSRDFRRKYPKVEMITQKDLTTLLLSSPNEDGTRSKDDSAAFMLQAPVD